MARPRKNQLRVLGPYRHRRQWRVVVVRPGGGERARRARRTFDTEEGAAAFIKRFQERQAGAGVTIDTAICEYERHLRSTGIKDVSVYTPIVRMRGFFAGELTKPVHDLSPLRMEQIYERTRERLRNGERAAPLAHEGEIRRVAVQTHQGMLSAAKRLTRWCVKRGYLRSDPAAKVEPVGIPHRGKEQLHFDEARALMDVCARELAGGDESALAVLVAIVLGLRASEVANLQVRDVDDGGRVVWVVDAKTPAGKRTQETDWLQPILAAFVEGRVGRLFPARSRHWVLYHTKRLCRLAGVPESTVHGLRGTHATAATEGGATAAQAMTGMGWTGIDVGRRHYIQAGAIESARVKRAAARLGPAPSVSEDVGNGTPSNVPQTK